MFYSMQGHITYIYTSMYEKREGNDGLDFYRQYILRMYIYIYILYDIYIFRMYIVQHCGGNDSHGDWPPISSKYSIFQHWGFS